MSLAVFLGHCAVLPAEKAPVRPGQGCEPLGAHSSRDSGRGAQPLGAEEPARPSDVRRRLQRPAGRAVCQRFRCSLGAGHWLSRAVSVLKTARNPLEPALVQACFVVGGLNVLYAQESLFCFENGVNGRWFRLVNRRAVGGL